MFSTLKEALKEIEARNQKTTKDKFKEILKNENIDYSMLKVIHITGTNGKGSTLNYVQAILKQLGYKVGTFSSPYIIKHNDRICINGEMINDNIFLTLINDCYPIIKKYNLSMFESDILIMLVYFIKEKVDYAVIEVGIGGLEDKTNIIDGEITVITSIGYDHLKQLGPTLKDIARHKAGIIKNNCQVVLPRMSESILNIFLKEAKNKQANVHLVDIPKIKSHPYKFSFKNYQNLMLENVGSYQVNNFLLALQTCLLINSNIDREIIDKVLSETFWVGRFEKINNIILDGAHNIDGISSLIETLKLMKIKKVGIIFSALNDKDYFEMLNLMLKESYYITVCGFEDKRVIDFEATASLNNINYFKDFNKAYETYLTKDFEIIVVTGSLHFISYVRGILV
jgi:folylpolyglutamate synthase/dihydrofolate synthase